MNNINHKNAIYLIGFLTVVIWVVLVIWNLNDLSYWVIIQKLLSALGVVFVVTNIFKKWLWKSGIFRGWLVLINDLSGEYKGVITPSQVNNSFPSFPKNISAVIKQTLFSLDIKVTSDESESNSFSHSFIKEQNGDVKIVYSYLGKPDINNRQVNSIHEGSAILLLIGNPPSKLRGEYWTSRGTIGEIELSKNSLKGT